MQLISKYPIRDIREVSEREDINGRIDQHSVVVRIKLVADRTKYVFGHGDFDVGGFATAHPNIAPSLSMLGHLYVASQDTAL
jgi:hypothetical protein